jgi:hypothetical protein
MGRGTLRNLTHDVTRGRAPCMGRAKACTGGLLSRCGGLAGPSHLDPFGTARVVLVIMTITRRHRCRVRPFLLLRVSKPVRRNRDVEAGSTVGSSQRLGKTGSWQLVRAKDAKALERLRSGAPPKHGLASIRRAAWKGSERSWSRTTQGATRRGVGGPPARVVVAFFFDTEAVSGTAADPRRCASCPAGSDCPP